MASPPEKRVSAMIGGDDIAHRTAEASSLVEAINPSRRPIAALR
jgi:hypothetical protein